jgi:hypothetical protein
MDLLLVGGLPQNLFGFRSPEILVLRVAFLIAVKFRTIPRDKLTALKLSGLYKDCSGIGKTILCPDTTLLFGFILPEVTGKKMTALYLLICLFKTASDI